ncbi:MAG: hypothetical protein WBM67_00560, partial [Sedimenticolaceae bacterium]
MDLALHLAYKVLRDSVPDAVDFGFAVGIHNAIDIVIRRCTFRPGIIPKYLYQLIFQIRVLVEIQEPT